MGREGWPDDEMAGAGGEDEGDAAALGRLVAAAESAVQCGVCSRPPADLVKLPCGEFFCAACLAAATKDEYLCPKCAVPFYRKDVTKCYAMVGPAPRPPAPRRQTPCSTPY